MKRIWRERPYWVGFVIALIVIYFVIVAFRLMLWFAFDEEEIGVIPSFIICFGGGWIVQSYWQNGRKEKE